MHASRIIFVTKIEIACNIFNMDSLFKMKDKIQNFNLINYHNIFIYASKFLKVTLDPDASTACQTS
jgi:hypothetical protein